MPHPKASLHIRRLSSPGRRLCFHRWFTFFHMVLTPAPPPSCRRHRHSPKLDVVTLIPAKMTSVDMIPYNPGAITVQLSCL